MQTRKVVDASRQVRGGWCVVHAICEAIAVGTQMIPFEGRNLLSPSSLSLTCVGCLEVEEKVFFPVQIADEVGSNAHPSLAFTSLFSYRTGPPKHYVIRSHILSLGHTNPLER